MKIKDKGDGWKVYADWYGQERVVFSPSSANPFVQLRQCDLYVKENS